MKLVIRLVAIAAVLVPLSFFVPSHQPAGLRAEPGSEPVRVKTKRRIAVLDFDFASTGLTGSVYNFAGGAGPAKGVSDLLTNRLVQDGTYIVVERSRVQEVLSEQDFGKSGRVEAATAAQIGRVLGVDAVVIGTVTRFDLGEEASRTSFGLFGLGNSSETTRAQVEINARLVNTTTAEILASADGLGTEEIEAGGFSFKGVSSDTAVAKRDELLSNAARKAIDRVVSEFSGVESKLAALPATLPNISALVADVTGNQVIINKGSKEGFKPGMTLSVERVAKTVKDPATGKVLRTVSAPIGQIQLVEVDGESAVGKVLRGQGFKVGDLVKAVQ
jgi:curli biogenesis system outer membrane secretion channel CsgG